MTSDPQTLPESRQDLVDLVIQQSSRIEQLEAKVRWFEEQFHLAERPSK
jgi:hypothetical protein